MKENWTYKKLGDIASFINGDRSSNYPSGTDFVENGIPFINAGHLSEGKIDFSQMNYITQPKYDSLRSGKIKENDILFCLRGSLGKCALVPQGLEGAIASSLVIIRPECASSLYLKHFLNSSIVERNIQRSNNGSSQPNLSAKSVMGFEVPLPSISIQQSIVAELDDINNLLQLKKKELEAFDKLAQSIFYEMFGDPVTNEKGWEVKKLSEVCSPKKEIKRASKMFAPNDIIEYIDISSIDNSTQKMTGCTNYVLLDAPSRAQQCVQYGDIIVSTVRPNLKNIAIVDSYENNLVASSGFCVLRPSNIERNYLFHFIISDNFTNHLMGLTTGANYPAVRDSDIIASTIPIPPLSLQQTFADCIEAIEQQKEQVKASINKLETLLASRMQYWFD